VTLVPGFPFVEGIARQTVVSAGLSDPSRLLIGLPQELQTPGYQSIQFILVHGLLLGWERSQNVTLDLGLHIIRVFHRPPIRSRYKKLTVPETVPVSTP
jgi:hypothetical protein